MRNENDEKFSNARGTIYATLGAWRRSECTYMVHTSLDEVYNATWGRSMMNGTIRPSDPLPMYDPRKDHNKYPAQPSLAQPSMCCIIMANGRNIATAKDKQDLPPRYDPRECYCYPLSIHLSLPPYTVPRSFIAQLMGMVNGVNQ